MHEKLTIDVLHEELHNMHRSGERPSAIVCTREQRDEFKASVEATKYMVLQPSPEPETIIGYPVNTVPHPPQRFVLNQRDAQAVKYRI